MSRTSGKHEPPPLPAPLRVAVADSHTHLDMIPPRPAPDGAPAGGGPRRAADASGSPGGPAAAPGDELAATPEDELDRAASVGVTTVVQVGCDVDGSRRAADLAARHDGVWAAVALHPNEAPRIVLGDPGGWSGRRRPPGGPAALDAAIGEITVLAALPQVRAVGETGLDYYRTGPEGRAVQHDSFRRHIDVAKRLGKALVIHDREAHDDVLRILDEEGAPERVVFHCYSGDADMAKICAERGWYLSFAGTVTFASARDLRAALAVAPLDLVLVETDAPFLTPAPYRGRTNAPYLIPVTVRAMAAVKGVDEDEMAAAIGANTARAFGYGP